MEELYNVYWGPEKRGYQIQDTREMAVLATIYKTSNVSSFGEITEIPEEEYKISISISMRMHHFPEKGQKILLNGKWI